MPSVSLCDRSSVCGDGWCSLDEHAGARSRDCPAISIFRAVAVRGGGSCAVRARGCERRSAARRRCGWDRGRRRAPSNARDKLVKQIQLNIKAAQNRKSFRKQVRDPPDARQLARLQCLEWARLVAARADPTPA
jgi:hypothetical protein